jgi:hypothetical protein
VEGFSLTGLHMRRFCVVAAIVGVSSLAGWIGHRLWPRVLIPDRVTLIPAWERVGERQVVKLPGRELIAEIGIYDDELFAYLMFQYFRGVGMLRNTEVLMTYRREAGDLVYPVQVRLENDLVAAIALLARAREAGLIQQYEWRYVHESALQTFAYQTRVFVTAYNLASRRTIEDMSRRELLSYVRRFVRFKSAIDPRIRRSVDPVPRPLTRSEAHELALDILTIVDFYSLPLEFFLGIGAMENNYMNIKGDLQHAVWKRRAEQGDIVLKRQRGRVLVLNPSSGVWQITRETLRYVHNLYLADHRDYSILPEHLRPPREVNLDELDPEVLTTYAGLLFRHLLDRFGGDVPTAVGAYNGGPGRPNPRYAEGVGVVAGYARRVLQQAAALHGQPAAGIRFFSARK